jgi:hypothetical protein
MDVVEQRLAELAALIWSATPAAPRALGRW